MELAQLPWLGRRLAVVDSTDPTLVGCAGLVTDETRHTILIDEDGKERRLAKAAIHFTIEGSEAVLNGRGLQHRPEDRVNLRGGW